MWWYVSRDSLIIGVIFFDRPPNGDTAILQTVRYQGPDEAVPWRQRADRVAVLVDQRAVLLLGELFAPYDSRTRVPHFFQDHFAITTYLISTAVLECFGLVCRGCSPFRFRRRAVN